MVPFVFQDAGYGEKQLMHDEKEDDDEEVTLEDEVCCAVLRLALIL